MSFEFDSARKRSSHVIFDGQNYKLIVKGADSSILSKLDEDLEHPFNKPTVQMLEKFSLLGYRTLVFATRYISKQEFKSMQKEYVEISNSLKGRKEKMSAFAEKMESNLVLLGMTAVEDSLQKNVPETIKRLLGADIKVWMITGDKLETAQNIGLMAGIVNHDMDIHRLSFKIKGPENRGGHISPSKAVNNCTVRDVFSREIERVNIELNSTLRDNQLREKNQLPTQKIAIVFDMRDVGKCLFTNVPQN